MARDTQDPFWKEISASLRTVKGKDILFVKMPISKAFMIILYMGDVLRAKFLSPEDAEYLEREFRAFLTAEIKGAQLLRHPSICYQVPVATAIKDVALLRDKVEGGTDSTLISQFRRALEAGLEDNPEVDWISRVGGPAPARPLFDLAEPADLSTTELFDEILPEN